MGIFKQYCSYQSCKFKFAWEKTIYFAKKHILVEIGIGSFSALASGMIDFLKEDAGSYLFGYHPIAVALFIAIGSIFFVLLSIWIYNFIASPFRIWTEQKETISIMQSALADKQTKAGKMAALANLLESGYALYTKKITEQEFPTWVSNVDKWRDRVLLVTESFFSKLEALSIANVMYRAKENYIHKVNDEHNTQLLILHERITNFENLIRKYQDDHE